MKVIYLAIGIFILGGLNEVSGKSVITEVEPENGIVSGFRFETKCSALSNGNFSFRLQVTEAGSRFSKSPNFALSLVKIDENSQSIKTVRPLKQRITTKSRMVEFTVSKTFVEDLRYCVTFVNYVEVEIKGKIVAMPSADFFILRLKKFSTELTRTR